MIEPLKNRLIVKRDETKTETESGFIIPDAAQRKELTGVVIATGPDVEEIKLGNRVIFGKVDGVGLSNKYFEEQGDFIMLREDQIKAIYV